MRGRFDQKVCGILFLVAAVLSCGHPLVAQQQAGMSDRCLARLRGYAQWHPAEADSAAWHLVIDRGSNGFLRIFGATHSRDPENPQFSAIASSWAAARPTVAFYEGPARPLPESREEVISQTGESGFVRFLAQRSGARIERLEPDPQAEVDAMLQHYSAEHVKLFYVLREAARLRQLGNHGAELDAAVLVLLGRIPEVISGLDGTFDTIEELAVAYRRHWSIPADWRDVPQTWFSPIDDGERTGGRFTNAINRLSSEFRDRHMATRIAEEFRAGERVFAVVGRNHVPMIAPGLRCELEG